MARAVATLRVGGAAIDWKGAQRVEQPAQPTQLKELLLGYVVDGTPHERADYERVEEGAMVRGEDHRTVLGQVLAAGPVHAEVEVEERLEDRPHGPVHERVHPECAYAGVEPGRLPRVQ